MQYAILLLTIAFQATVAFAQKSETKTVTMIVKSGALGKIDTILYDGPNTSQRISKEISIIAGDSVPNPTTITIHANDLINGDPGKHDVSRDNIKMMIIQDGKESTIDLNQPGQFGPGIKNLNIRKIIKGDSVTITVDSFVINNEVLTEEVFRHGSQGKSPRNMCDMQLVEFDQPGLNPATLGVLIEDTDEGVVITDILEGSAAQLAGFRRGDVLLKVNKRYIFTSRGLLKALHPFNPGDKVKITCLREGKEIKRATTLQKRKE